ncbi:MAG: hypothetical protein MPJ24_11000 [Pirellulaceae bacterium]|nr:hypothetical protein [Pirellulaceae bacterium]
MKPLKPVKFAFPFLPVPFALLLLPDDLAAIFFAGIFLLVLLISWSIYCVFEYQYRRSAHVHCFPWFGLTGGIFLAMIPFAFQFTNSTMGKYPRFSRTIQSVKWSTSQDNPKWDDSNYFVLVLIADGTLENHQVVAGHMNWTGDEPAGFSSIRFHPISLQNKYYEEYHVADIDYLKSRIEASTLPQMECDLLAEDIWKVLGQAENGEDIQADLGVTDGPASNPYIEDNLDIYIGSSIWGILLLVVFMVVGRFSQRTVSD